MASLKHRLALAAAAIVTVSQAATIALVLYLAKNDAEERANERLSIGSGVVADFMNNHKAQLDTTVTVLAADFAFRTAIASLDMPTVTSVLRNHAARIGADESMLVGRDGRVLASASTQIPLPSSTWTQIVENSDQLLTLEDGDRLYQVVVAPVRAPEQIGWVVMGFRIDDLLAIQLRNLIGMEVSFARPNAQGVYASSLARTPRAHSEGNDYFTLRQPLPGAGARPLLVLQLSRAEALASFHDLSQWMLALGAIALLFALFGASFTSNRLTRHLKTLVDVARRVSAGDYSLRVAIPTNDEIEALADALTSMQDGIAAREQQIRHQATHDPLTDLPTHDQAVRTLDEWMTRGAPFTVIVLHFGGLEDINSSLGIEVGDAVVQSIARRLADHMQEGDYLARFVDSRFLIATRARSPALIGALATRLRSEFEVFSTASSDIQVGLTLQLGVAEFPDHARDGASLVRKAWGASIDAASAKSAIAFYNVDRDAQHQRRLTIMRDMKAAVLDDQLSVVYQPKYNVRESRIDGVEALLRWHHPTLGAVPVVEFIQVAEQTRNIGRLTRWVLRRAIAQTSLWRQRGHDLAVAINVSAHDLTDSDFPHYVASVLQEALLPGRALQLEVTEGALVYDLPRVRRTLEALEAQGVTIAIDDYGTGFSSLAQIRDLSVHVLKIDRSFVMNLNGSDDNEHIVRSTIDLGHALELKVVAEGVEDENVAAKLIRWGCDHLQGYYFSKPLPAADIEAVFARKVVIAKPPLPLRQR